MKKIILLGATGSIGTQTIDVVNNHSDQFEIIAMACGHNIAGLIEIIKSSKCLFYNVARAEDAIFLAKRFPQCTFTYGDDGILSLIEHHADEADIVVNALVGFLGLLPSLKTIECHLDLALANKESLVAGGDLVLKALKENQVNLYPIDSEHSAIFQCLRGNKHQAIKKLVITASGGSFRDLSREELKNVTVEMALNHPNWKMGKRITVDSATMMNKGFEVIEAHYLFDVDYDAIDVIINKQSVIHSMVEYVDKSFIAQLGTADMRLPIQYALTYPNRIELVSESELNLASIKTLDFQAMDYERFPLLKLAFEAGKRGGNSTAILNAADETAVSLCLNHEISFLDIERYIFAAYENIGYIKDVTIEDIIETDRKTRAFILEAVRS